MTRTILDLTAWRTQAIEALGTVDGMSFQPRPGGEVYTVPHPLLLTDEQNREVDAVSGVINIVPVLLGKAVFSRFVADGGRAGDIMLAWRMMQQSLSLDPNSPAYTASSDASLASSNLTSSTDIRANTGPFTSGGELSSPAPAN